MKEYTQEIAGAIVVILIVLIVFASLHGNKILQHMSESRQGEACLELKKEAIKAGQPSPDCKL